jgi:topoisomerase-4 subunit B
LADAPEHRITEEGCTTAEPCETAAPCARTTALVETLMGRRPELRFDYIQKNARFVRDLDL